MRKHFIFAFLSICLAFLSTQAFAQEPPSASESTASADTSATSESTASAETSVTSESTASAEEDEEDVDSITLAAKPQDLEKDTPVNDSDTDEAEAKGIGQNRLSANGSYAFKPSWGVGLQYGVNFTDMQNWTDDLLKPNYLNDFSGNVFVGELELYVEYTPIDGLRVSAFGGWQSNYHFEDTGFHYFYGGIEPAWSVRRSFYEFAVGLGLGYGQYRLMNEAVGNTKGHGMLVRPFVEARLYPAELFAIYLRLGFDYMKSFGIDLPPGWNGNADALVDKPVSVDNIMHAGPYIALGIRLGSYPTPTVVISDSDGDTLLDDVDTCPETAGREEFEGCQHPDSDLDGVCDPWVADKGLSENFSNVCKGTDSCLDVAEDKDSYSDSDGCPDPDNDGDGLCDPWVLQEGKAELYASVCKSTDSCANDAEDFDGFEDEDGCPDYDNDKDGFCDLGFKDTELSSCRATDQCPLIPGPQSENGCPDPDSDLDGYCEEWVYTNKLEANFPKCKGVDKCPNELGEDDKGCKYRRVEVTADKIQINEAINFAVNKSTIQKTSDSLIEEIAKIFKENPQIKKVEIQGHTDLAGKAKKNQTLSEGRAKAVYERLIKLGVEKERLVYKGYGMTQPVEPLAVGQKKETPEQAAKNRRVIFLILEQDTVTTTTLVAK